MKLFAILLLTVQAVGSLTWNRNVGPHWLASRQSPDYAYLLTAKALLQGNGAQAIAGHPGFSYTLFLTPLFGMARSISPKPTAVTVDTYPAWLYWCSQLQILVYFSALVMLLLFLPNLTSGEIILVSLLSVTSLVGYERITRLAPEAFLLVVVTTALMAARRNRWTTAGVLFGVGLTAKITVAPTLLLLWPDHRGARLSFVKGAAGTVVLCAAWFHFPIPQYGWHWQPHQIVPFIQQLLREEPWLVLALAFARDPRLTGAAIVAFICALGNPSPHYLLPLLPAALLRASERLSDKNQLLIGITLLIIAVQIPRLLGTFSMLKQTNAARLDSAAQLGRLNRPVVSCNFASSPLFALCKGAAQAGVLKELAIEIPNLQCCDINRQVVIQGERELPLANWLALRPEVVVQGPPGLAPTLYEQTSEPWQSFFQTADEVWYQRVR